jgi:pyruvate/oxaloacetate carboxyltransferase
MLPKNKVKIERVNYFNFTPGEVGDENTEVILEAYRRVCETDSTLSTASSGIYTEKGLEVGKAYLIYLTKGDKLAQIDDDVTIYDFNGENISGKVRKVRNTRILNKIQEVFVSVN